MDFQTLGTTALLSFGVVWIVDFFLIKYTKINLDTQGKLILSGIAAFVIGLIPADLGIALANQIKIAVEVAVGLTGFYQGGKGIAKQVGGAV